MAAVFVTSTGTDIGKTFVTAGLIRELRRRGRAVDALKPVVSGFDETMAEASDPGILLTALGRSVTIETLAGISPWRFKAPLSPDLAAQRESRTLDVDAVVTFSGHAIADNVGTLLIEGVGGVMAPLDEQRTMLDWMTELGLPLILVAGSYLGTISHTLSALDVVARRGLTVTALVVSETVGSSVSLDDTVATISRFASPIDVLGVPRLSNAAAEHQVFRHLAALL